MRQSSSNSMEGKFTKCSECVSKNCTHCEKIVLKVVGTSDSAKELYNTVLAALDKVDVDASVVLSPDNSECKEFADPMLVYEKNVLFSGRVPSVIEVVAMVLMLGH